MTGGWAATNTLREAVRSLAGWESIHGVEESPEWEQRPAALALVEAALAAAEKARVQVYAFLNGQPVRDLDEALERQDAALRAVREGK